MADRSHAIPLAVGLMLCAILLGIWIWIEQKPLERVSPPPGKALAIDKSTRSQAERKAVLDRLIEQAYVRRYDRKGPASVQVALRPSFYQLDEETRTKYLHEVYAYYFDGSSTTDTLTLRDARHGNNVGRYNPYTDGLVMYK